MVIHNDWLRTAPNSLNMSDRAQSAAVADFTVWRLITKNDMI